TRYAIAMPPRPSSAMVRCFDFETLVGGGMRELSISSATRKGTTPGWRRLFLAPPGCDVGSGRVVDGYENDRHVVLSSSRICLRDQLGDPVIEVAASDEDLANGVFTEHLRKPIGAKHVEVSALRLVDEQIGGHPRLHAERSAQIPGELAGNAGAAK